MDRKIGVAHLPVPASPEADHHRQILWQVRLPVIAGALLALAVAILAIIGTVQGNSEVNRWGNISAIFIIIPVLLVGILLLALTGGIVYGLAKLLQKMPDWMLAARFWMARLAVIVRQGADAVTQPVLYVNTTDARVRAFWKKIFKG